MKRQIRYDSKHAIIKNNSYELITNPEVNPERNTEEIEKGASEKNMEIMWEKLVLYYLSRLKGLCDWRLNEGNENPECSTSNTSVESGTSSISDHLEEEIVKQATMGMIKGTKCESLKNITDFGTYMAAGYAEGKHQAAKIVIRSLRYGLLTGILIKCGSNYKIQPKYLRKKLNNAFKFCNRKRKNKKKYNNLYRKTKQILRNGVKLRNRKKVIRKEKIKPCYCLCNDKAKDSLHYIFNKKARSKSSSISEGRASSNSISSKSSAGPRAKKKSSKVRIKKPVIVKRPPRKRNKSQTKSPTPIRSESNTSNKRYKPRKLKTRSSEGRRNCSVLSSMSSIYGMFHHCNKKRSASSCSCTEKNVKKVKHSYKEK